MSTAMTDERLEAIRNAITRGAASLLPGGLYLWRDAADLLLVEVDRLRAQLAADSAEFTRLRQAAEGHAYRPESVKADSETVRVIRETVEPMIAAALCQLYLCVDDENLVLMQRIARDDHRAIDRVECAEIVKAALKDTL